MKIGGSPSLLKKDIRKALADGCETRSEISGYIIKLGWNIKLGRLGMFLYWEMKGEIEVDTNNTRNQNRYFLRE